MKTKLKCIGLTLFALMAATTVNGQEDKDYYVARDRALHATDQNVVSGPTGVGWVRSHFFDDWFFQVQGGGQLYYGTDDREGPLGDRLTGNMEFQFGRRIFPMFGFRAGIGMGYAHGFLTKDHYTNYSVSTGGDGICGDDASGNSLGGYFWDYNNDLLMQKWKYFYFGADLWLNLAIFKGADNYKQFRPWEHIVYGGVHTKYALSEVDDKNHRSEAHLGYICKYNFKNNLSVYADVRYSFIERLFDREHVQSIESAGFGVDGVLNFHVGVMYKFHTRTEDERAVFVQNVKTVTEQEVKTVTVRVTKKDTIYSRTVYDSTVMYNQVNIPTPETSRLKDSLLALVKERQEKNKNINYVQDLSDIFLNQLLPYEMVFFKLDKWDILPEEEMKIDKMARIMKAYPDNKFLLYGSADSKTGTVKRNDFLSHRRADVVYDLLVGQYGIDPNQLERIYLGGILDYTPFELNRATVIIMDHPTVKKAFEEMKAQGQAGGGSVEMNK